MGNTYGIRTPEKECAADEAAKELLAGKFLCGVWSEWVTYKVSPLREHALVLIPLATLSLNPKDGGE